MWVNLFTGEMGQYGFLESIQRLGWGNALLLGGLAALVTAEVSAQRGRVLRQRSFERRYEIIRFKQRSILQGLLRIVCELISNTLGVTCNARYFVAVHDPDGTVYLQQDRELAVLNLRMPREYGFTRIAVGTPHIVNSRSYLERTPIYEELPVDHTNLYDHRVAQMIDPRQRWVLACPVLTLDPETNQHSDKHPPRGILTFYSIELPQEQDKDRRVELSLDYAAQFAEQMSQVLSTLDIAYDLGARDEPMGERTT